jgi:hypothetical protein
MKINFFVKGWVSTFSEFSSICFGSRSTTLGFEVEDLPMLALQPEA